MKLINLLIKKNQRLSFNSANDLKSENKKLEDIVDHILNDFTIKHPQESDHLFYPNTADEINKQSQDEEKQKRRLDIIINERQREIEKEMIFDGKKNLLKTLAGIDEETTERMIEQNNMEIIAKRLVDNIKKTVAEVKNEKPSK